MTYCIICGKELGFFPSILGNNLCNECKKNELQKIEAEKTKQLAALHQILTINLHASSKDKLQEIKWDNEVSRSKFDSLASSMKNDEKIYVVCAAIAKRLKYIKSRRSNVGTSMPFFGLKGFRLYSSYGQSTPVYDYVNIGEGLMTLTDKNIHLCTHSGKPLKIPYSKIEGFHLYNDGLELYHGLQKPTLFELNAVDPMQIDTIGHIIDLNTK
jgi:hypothetical protein